MQENNKYKIIYDLDEIFPSDGDNGYELKTINGDLEIEIKYFAGEDTNLMDKKIIRFARPMYFYKELYYGYIALSNAIEPIYSNLLVEYENSNWRDTIPDDFSLDEFHHYELVLISAQVVINVLAKGVKMLDVD